MKTKLSSLHGRVLLARGRFVSFFHIAAKFLNVICAADLRVLLKRSDFLFQIAIVK